MSSSKVDFGKLGFKNPVVMASGTFGFGKEYGEIYDISKLGGISTKGITLEKRAGNKGIRVWETPSGMMNSVGLENPGVEGFLEEEAAFLSELDTRVIVNVSGSRMEDYSEAVKRIENTSFDIVELNISCPNLKSGGMAFGTNADSAYEIVKEIRKNTQKMLMVKLSPNVGDIAEIASACVSAGADAISLINTIQAMAVDIYRRKIIFDNTYAGLSGPAVRPIALRMVHQVAKAVNVPIMGMGGITSGEDAISFIMAGASCVQIGTANFMDLRAGTRIVEEIEAFMDRENVKSLSEIRAYCKGEKNGSKGTYANIQRDRSYSGGTLSAFIRKTQRGLRPMRKGFGSPRKSRIGGVRACGKNKKPGIRLFCGTCNGRSNTCL